MHSRSAVLALVVAGALGACETASDRAELPRYEGDVQALVEARCLRCHADPAPAGGWSATTYRVAIGCKSDTIPQALARPDHASFASGEERARIASWLAAGAPARRSGVHPAAFGNPRAGGNHAALLRARAYQPMIDANDPDACGVCHDGVASRPPKVLHAAPDAPACTTCHATAEGPLACGTCHGDGASRAAPPRDPCFYPSAARDAHAAHAPLGCATCHPTPTTATFDATHVNGSIDVRCTGTCHARGGARPTPAWSDGAMGCNDCHASPPKDHYGGACTSCHAEANASGTALTARTLHANGKVDLGDGSGRCAACHGSGDSPLPLTGAHAAHAQPANGKPVPCETCHEVPSGGARHPLGRGSAAVRLTGLAVRGGRRASFDAATKTCAGTYCHEGSNATSPAPRWTDPATTCSSCHGAPPPPPHAQRTTCGESGCHQDRTNGDHVDGILNLGPR